MNYCIGGELETSKNFWFFWALKVQCKKSFDDSTQEVWTLAKTIVSEHLLSLGVCHIVSFAVDTGGFLTQVKKLILQYQIMKSLNLCSSMRNVVHSPLQVLYQTPQNKEEASQLGHSHTCRYLVRQSSSIVVSEMHFLDRK